MHFTHPACRWPFKVETRCPIKDTTYTAVLTASRSSHYSHFYAFTNRCKYVQQNVTSLLLYKSCLAAVWYSDWNWLVSAQLARAAVGKQEFVHVTSWNRYILLGSGSCKVTWLCVVLNKREWVWVRGVGCGGWTKRDLIVMAVCRSNLTLSLYLSSPHAVVCVFFLARAWGWVVVLCVSALCEPTLNIPARKAGSDTSYY